MIARTLQALAAGLLAAAPCAPAAQTEARSGHALRVLAGLGFSYVSVDHRDGGGRRIEGTGTGGYA